MGKRPHVLIMRLSAMGDVAMLQPVLVEFQKQHPEVDISILTQPHFLPIFQDIKFKHKLPFAKDSYRGVHGLWKCYQDIRTYNFDQVLDMHDVLRTQLLRSFFRASGTAVLKIDKGRKEKRALTRRKNKVLQQLESGHERYADVLRAAGYDVRLSHSLMEVNTTRANGIGIAPLAAFEQKTWSSPNVQLLIKKILETSETQIYLFGGPADVEALNTYCQIDVARVHNLAQMQLSEQIQEMKKMRVMLSMDSANQHLASIAGVPCVSLWMATHPFAGFKAYGQSDELQIQCNDLSCRPCSVYGNKTCWRERPYCKDLEVDSVLEVLQHYIN